METGIKSYFQEIEEFFIGLAKIIKSFFAFFGSMGGDADDTVVEE